MEIITSNSYLYLLKNKEGTYFKIGKADCVEQRLISLNANGLFSIDHVNSIKFNIAENEVFFVEKTLHRIFYKYNYTTLNPNLDICHLDGYSEWFSIDCYDFVLEQINMLRRFNHNISLEHETVNPPLNITTNLPLSEIRVNSMINNAETAIDKLLEFINFDDISYEVLDNKLNVYFINSQLIEQRFLDLLDKYFRIDWHIFKFENIYKLVIDYDIKNSLKKQIFLRDSLINNCTPLTINNALFISLMNQYSSIIEISKEFKALDNTFCFDEDDTTFLSDFDFIKSYCKRNRINDLSELLDLFSNKIRIIKQEQILLKEFESYCNSFNLGHMNFSKKVPFELNNVYRKFKINIALSDSDISFIKNFIYDSHNKKSFDDFIKYLQNNGLEIDKKTISLKFQRNSFLRDIDSYFCKNHMLSDRQLVAVKKIFGK